VLRMFRQCMRLKAQTCRFWEFTRVADMFGLREILACEYVRQLTALQSLGSRLGRNSGSIAARGASLHEWPNGPDSSASTRSVNAAPPGLSHGLPVSVPSPALHVIMLCAVVNWRPFLPVSSRSERAVAQIEDPAGDGEAQRQRRSIGCRTRRGKRNLDAGRASLSWGKAGKRGLPNRRSARVVSPRTPLALCALFSIAMRRVSFQ